MRPVLTGLPALLLRCGIVLCVLAGVLWASGRPFGDPALSLRGLGLKLVFFTIQSNLVLAAVTAWSVVAQVRGRAQPPLWVVGGATFFVTVTFLVYNTILVPGGGDGAVLLLSGYPSSDLLHVVAPLLAVLDWVFGRPQPGFTVRRSLVWLLYPLGYTAFALVRGQLTDSDVRYPYFFLDVDEIGWDGVGLAFSSLLVAFALLAVVFALADRRLGRAGRARGRVSRTG